jgi:hypothetical protein
MSLPPANPNEASLGSDWLIWKAAATIELTTMKDMRVYHLAKLPDGRREIRCRWVLEYKLGPDGDLMPKAHLVAQGYSQIPGLDYSVHDTFAAVTKTPTVRFVAATAACFDWDLDVFDATREFLWGFLNEPVYIKQPKGFEEGDGLVWELLRSVYRLKQASNVWYKKLRALLETFGFHRSEADHALCISKVDHLGVIAHCLLAVHMDDGLAASNSRVFLMWVKSEIKKAFVPEDLGPAKRFLGMEIKRNRETSEVCISEVQYIESILAEYGMTGCNPIFTPMAPLYPSGRPSDNFDAYLAMSLSALISAYQRLVGHILFLVLCTRPDGQQTVRLLSHCSAPQPCHLLAAKRFLRYLAGTRTLALHYGGAAKDDALIGYCDADWANDLVDHMSISGYVWFYAGGPIYWSSKKQTTHALASTDTEYMAISKVVREGLWLRSQGITASSLQRAHHHSG